MPYEHKKGPTENDSSSIIFTSQTMRIKETAECRKEISNYQLMLKEFLQQELEKLEQQEQTARQIINSGQSTERRLVEARFVDNQIAITIESFNAAIEELDITRYRFVEQTDKFARYVDFLKESKIVYFEEEISKTAKLLTQARWFNLISQIGEEGFRRIKERATHLNLKNDYLDRNKLLQDIETEYRTPDILHSNTKLQGIRGIRMFASGVVVIGGVIGVCKLLALGVPLDSNVCKASCTSIKLLDEQCYAWLEKRVSSRTQPSSY